MSSRTFTGRKFALLMVAGFGVVIAVNLALAVLAARSHPGMVVESSHVAGQKFNAWLEAGRQQRAQGWAVTATVADGRMLDVLALDPQGRPLPEATIEARVRHPLGADEAAVVVLAHAGGGHYRAPLAVPPGQWDVEIHVRRGAETHWMRTRVRVAD